MKYIFLLLSFLLLSCAFAQEKIQHTLEGSLVDAQTKNPLPYAKIYNKTTKTGTITNDEGYFKIGIHGVQDEIVISQIGYKTQSLLYDLNLSFQRIEMDARLQMIQEMVASPRDFSYLCDLIQKCRLTAGKTKNEGKAYYELKSFIDTSQIELVEGYYNYSSIGYDLRQLELKAGRLAIQPNQGKMFMSLESSKAIAQLQLFEPNVHFPIGPFDMKARQIQKKYYLNLTNKYLLDNKDSVYVINYHPRDTSGAYFTGTIWINKSRFQVLKVTTNCKDCSNYPFLPIFTHDEILKIDMHITKTFQESQGKMCFNHVDFQYDIDYKSLIRDSAFWLRRFAVNPFNDSLYEKLRIKTKAVLYSYAFQDQFNLPKFKFGEGVSDYRKINGLPYNSFFWENNDEDRVNHQKSNNQLFFTDSSSVRDKELFNLYFYGSNQLAFVLWYKEWSKNRIRFRNISEAEREHSDDVFKNKPAQPVIQSETYELKVQLFADRDTYGDSTKVITAAIFDPFDSFYYLPMDMATHCFINMYFDIHEIARRELQIELENDVEHFDEVYTLFLNKFEKTKRQFFKDVERGTKEKEMKKWNSYIFQNLGIDNLALFNPFSTKEIDLEKATEK